VNFGYQTRVVIHIVVPLTTDTKIRVRLKGMKRP